MHTGQSAGETWLNKPGERVPLGIPSAAREDLSTGGGAFVLGSAGGALLPASRGSS